MSGRRAEAGVRRLAHAYRPAISIFLVWHLFALAVWLVPVTSPLHRRAVDAVSPYVLGLGFWQAWNMFAPVPLNQNAHLEARVTFADGSVEVWPFPRTADLPLPARYVSERDRKWVENLDRWSGHAAWPDAARHAARRVARPDRRPVKVALERVWADVPPMVTGLDRPPPPRDRREVFFIHPITPEDLR